MIKNFLNEIDGINVVDIGSSGSLDKKWNPISKFINLIGFDPNAEECSRMESLPHTFKSVKYLPYAIAGEMTANILYKTKSIYCYSLLRPNMEWLRRFSFYEKFESTGEEPLQTKVLRDIEDVQRLNVDVLKTDAQGLELPILQNAGHALTSAFMVETETGFVENYFGETTYAQIDEFMRANSFLLFDLNTSHRIPRNNIFKKAKTGAEQLLWCEAVWLKDYIELAKRNVLAGENFSREKVLKALILCSIQGCIDYGFEIACLAHDMTTITNSELKSLESKDSWNLDRPLSHSQNSKFGLGKILSYGLRLLPIAIRKEIHEQAGIAVKRKHLLRF